MFEYTRFQVYMIDKSVRKLIPFIILFVGHLLNISSVFSATAKHGEVYYINDDENDDYK